MKSVSFEIPTEQLNKLLEMYPNKGKNSDVGNIAVMVAELYFKSLDPDSIFTRGSIDLQVTSKGRTENYEIKGTEDADIAWAKLKVSSRQCYDELVAGMILIRVTNIRNAKVILHFMKYGEDFTMVEEPRWSIKKVSNK
ncbi:hypothetical protein [Limnovirga soli]|uniref:Uncharacterized protein n=1 Tax=Limnovirga soli TaxID=2656915 RepID=A0A8J8JSP1_9BACT|nr:hypothetical protein [Limnovirga soli]NNV57197.1 hypothetical protein [Limnovirga soli]